MKEKATEQPASNDTQRPKNPLANVLTTKPKPLSDDVSATRPKNLPANLRPIEGYIIEIDGKLIGIRKLRSCYESRLGAQDKISANPGQSIRRKRANSDASRII